MNLHTLGMPTSASSFCCRSIMMFLLLSLLHFTNTTLLPSSVIGIVHVSSLIYRKSISTFYIPTIPKLCACNTQSTAIYIDHSSVSAIKKRTFFIFNFHTLINWQLISLQSFLFYLWARSQASSWAKGMIIHLAGRNTEKKKRNEKCVQMASGMWCVCPPSPIGHT